MEGARPSCACLELLPRELTVPENLGQQSGADYLGTMHGYGCGASVRVRDTKMTPSYSDNCEPRPLQSLDYSCSGQSRQAAHALMETRWIPTNSSGAPSEPGSTSRCRAIASRIRSISSSRDRACVWQPGKEGTLAMKVPSSSRSMTTLKSLVMKYPFQQARSRCFASIVQDRSHRTISLAI